MKHAIGHKYDRLAHDYDRRWSDYIQRTIQATRDALPLQHGDRLLDIGCGTGALLDTVTRDTSSITCVGVDLSMQMVRAARDRLSKRAALFLADAQLLPFDTGVFDVAVSCNNFHYWPRPHQGLMEIVRVLRPGGVFVLTDWCADGVWCRAFDIWLRLWTRTHQRTYRMDQCRRLLSEAGFTAIHVQRYKLNWFWSMMTAQATAGVA